MVVEVFEYEEADSSFERCDASFCGVEFELERPEEISDSSLVFLECSFFLAEYEEVVDIAYVVLRFEFVLHILVKLVQVGVSEELACPVPERHSLAGLFGWMVLEDDVDEPEDVFVLDALSQDGDENFVVDGVKVVLDVCFECVARDVVLVLCLSSLFAVLCRLVCEFVESFDGVVCPFSFPARVAVVDEAWFEDWLENID